MVTLRVIVRSSRWWKSAVARSFIGLRPGWLRPPESVAETESVASPFVNRTVVMDRYGRAKSVSGAEVMCGSRGHRLHPLWKLKPGPIARWDTAGLHRKPSSR